MSAHDAIVLVSVVAWPAMAAFALGCAIALARQVLLPRGTIARLVAAQALLEAQTAALAKLTARVDRVEGATSEGQTAWTTGMGR